METLRQEVAQSSFAAALPVYSASRAHSGQSPFKSLSVLAPSFCEPSCCDQNITSNTACTFGLPNPGPWTHLSERRNYARANFLYFPPETQKGRVRIVPLRCFWRSHYRTQPELSCRLLSFARRADYQIGRRQDPEVGRALVSAPRLVNPAQPRHSQASRSQAMLLYSSCSLQLL